MIHHLSPLLFSLFSAPLLCAQAGPVYPDRVPVEIEVAPQGLQFDADHTALAFGRNGDMLVVWSVKDSLGKSTEIQAAYFTFVATPVPRWEPSESVVLGGLDAQGRRCLRPDVELTYDPSFPDLDAFVVVWARAENGTANGKIESALVQAPTNPGQPPVVLHSDGVSGFPLDDQVDTNLTNGTPDIAWHPKMGLGRFGVVYSHRQSDDFNGHAEITVRWREAVLPITGQAQILAFDQLTTGVKVEGALYGFSGGAVKPDAVLMPANSSSLNLILGFEESAAINGTPGGGAMIRVQVYKVIPGIQPSLRFETALDPDPAIQENLLRRPMLSWNRVPSNSDTAQLAIHVVNDASGTLRKAHSYSIHIANQTIVMDPWVPGFRQQKAPTVAAFSNSHLLVFQNGTKLQYAHGDSAGLSDGIVDLGSGNIPAMDMLEGVWPGGKDVVAISAFDPSAVVAGAPRRIWVRLIVADL